MKKISKLLICYFFLICSLTSCISSKIHYPIIYRSCNEPMIRELIIERFSNYLVFTTHSVSGNEVGRCFVNGDTLSCVTFFKYTEEDSVFNYNFDYITHQNIANFTRRFKKKRNILEEISNFKSGNFDYYIKPDSNLHEPTVFKLLK